jgi:hypothetical protein
MADPNAREGSWWTTVPGILTALAATIIAVGGLIAVLTQAGLIDRGTLSRIASAEPAPAVGKAANHTTAPAGNPARESNAIAHSPAEVISGLRAERFKGIAITQNDGTVIPVRPGTFQVRGSVSGFPLANGQTIDFDRVKGVDVLSQDRLRLLLVNGQQIEADVEGPFYYLVGENDLGQFRGHIKEVTRIDFLR